MKLISILPIDSYIVVNKSLLNDNDRLILTMLYQPIVGSIAISLYFTLWADLNKTAIMSNEYTHHHLMNTMSLKLDDIISARKKLEAIGLLKSYYKIGQINNYVYEIYSPLSSNEFFTNPLLSSALLSSIGKKEYQSLLSYYKIPKINMSEFENITTSFSDIYKMCINEEAIESNVKKKDKLDLVIDDVVDFNFIISSMPKGICNLNTFTSSMKKLINRLSYLYEEYMGSFEQLWNDSKSIDICIKDGNKDFENELKKNCKNYYSFENKNPPKLIYKSSNKKIDTKDIKNIKERLIECFECTTPYDFLTAKYGGAKPTSKDVNLIESLLVDQQLNPGVVNVLIDYVLRINDKKLNKNFVEAIASQWKLSNINTVSEAMKQAEKEYRKSNKLKETKENYNKKEVEKLPTWYGKNIKKEQMSNDDIKELEDMLSDFV